MKTLKSLLLAASLLVASAFGQTAQNTLTSTTLSAALTSASTQQFNLASATGISTNPATLLYVDKEAMFVTAVSGTRVSVIRGFNGTQAQPHINAAKVLAGRPNWFNVTDPSGACTNVNVVATPYVNIRNGYQWLCSTISLGWVPGFGNSDISPAVTTAVASATTLLPSGPLFHVTGTTATATFTLPVGLGVGNSGGSFCVIADGVWTWTAAGNITVAGTVTTAGSTVCFTFDAATAKFAPSRLS